MQMPGRLGTGTPMRGEGLKKLDVVQEGSAKPVDGIRVVGADVIENDLKID